MDRFKYRIWHKEFKQFLGIEEWSVFGDGSVNFLDFRDGGFVPAKSNDDVVIEQCTGMRDINGKLIYEGDIVKRFNTEYVYTVKYDEEKLTFVGRDNDGDFIRLCNFKFEIIGMESR